MNDSLDTQLHKFCIPYPSLLMGFLAFFLLLFVFCGLLLLSSGFLAVTFFCAWLIYDSAHDGLNIFSIRDVLQSVVEELAVFIGIEPISEFTRMDTEHNDYRYEFPWMNILNSRRRSSIPGFSDDPVSGRGDTRKSHHPSPLIMDILHCADSYLNISDRASRDPCSSLKSTSGSPSPSYLSAVSMVSIDRIRRTPDHKLSGSPGRRAYPRWSGGGEMKINTPSPFELSPGDVENPNEYLPSPQRWPSPASDTTWAFDKEGTLRAKLQKTIFSDYATSGRMFITDDIGNTHILETDEPIQKIINSVQKSSEDCIPGVSLKLERKLFASHLREKPSSPKSASMSEHYTPWEEGNVLPTGFKKETFMTIGWNRKYKDLITEMKLKGSLEMNESEEQLKPENFRPMLARCNNPHWTDTPRLEPLDRPYLDKLQRWGLGHDASRTNFGQNTDLTEQRSVTPITKEIQPIQELPAILKQDYNFGNLEMSPGKVGAQPDPEDSDCCKHWEGFDDAYSITESVSPQQVDGEEGRWKLSMGKWAEKGVEVMKPVDEEGRDDGSYTMSSPCSARAVLWPSPISQSSDREHLLRDSPTSENSSAHDVYSLGTADIGPRTPSPPLLPLKGSEMTDILEENKKNNALLGDTPNRIFPRRVSRAPRSSVTSQIAPSPPRPLPVKLIRMFEDLSKPLLIGPRTSSINYSPERLHSSPGKTEGGRAQELNSPSHETGDDIGATSAKEVGKNLSSIAKNTDDGLSECF